MGLFRRTSALEVSVTPAVVVPRQTVTAVVTGAADKVRSAKVDWGYTNFFRYRWAGHADSAAAEIVRISGSSARSAPTTAVTAKATNG